MKRFTVQQASDRFFFFVWRKAGNVVSSSHRRGSVATGPVEREIVSGRVTLAEGECILIRIVLRDRVVCLHFVGDDIAGTAIDLSVHIHRPMTIPVDIMPVE